MSASVQSPRTAFLNRLKVLFLLLFPLAIGLLITAASSEQEARDQAAKVQAVEKPFDQLSHTELTPFGQKALSIEPSKWRHAESDHFIIHYQSDAVKNRLIREAEYYYWKIKNDLKLTADLVNHKSHIFIFQDEAQWRQFQANVDVLQILGVTVGNEFFCYYEKHQDEEFSGNVAHEMTHLVFNRFFSGRPPLWLNEGYAEYQSKNAFKSLYGRKLKVARDPSGVSQIDFLEMTGWSDYPSGPYKGAFYVKSQMAVDLLIQDGGPERFVSFVNAIIEDHDFQKAFKKYYVNVYNDTDQFIRKLANKVKRL